MAHNLTNYAENKLLEHSVGKRNWTPPTATYAALYTAESEVTEGSYLRKAITWGYASNEVITNSAAITFPIATSAWGTIANIGVADTAVGGNIIWYGPVEVERTVEIGDVYEIGIGELELTL